ncbi:MAG: T9SS type A sorting domain-containing protein [Saprospiraceae bacterium]
MNHKAETILFDDFGILKLDKKSSKSQALTIIAPPDMVVSCSFKFDFNLLTDPTDRTFGSIVASTLLRKKVVVEDIVCHKFCEKNAKINYLGGYVSTNTIAKQACDKYNAYFDTARSQRRYELTWGFDGYFNDPDSSTPVIKINDKRQCGIGKIERVITASGGNHPMDSAVQTIWIIDCDPFFVDSLHCNDSLYSDVIWPDEICSGKIISIYDCGSQTNPNNPKLGVPRIVNRPNSNSNCSLVAIEYKEQLISNTPKSCYRIIRTWVVIDWCQYDPFISATFGRWEASQLIDVYDTTKPNIQISIGKQEVPNGNGLAFILLNQIASDSCAGNNFVSLDYKIDELNDGIGKYPGGFDHKVGSLNQQEFKLGILPKFSDNIRVLNPNNPFDASGSYPIGKHKIIWTATDQCGNSKSAEEIFEIKFTVGVKDYFNHEKEFILTPNPTNGNVTIRILKEIDRLELISTIGSSNHCYNVDNKQIIEINDISNGVYFVRAIKNGKLIATEKLVVIK